MAVNLEERRKARRLAALGAFFLTSLIFAGGWLLKWWVESQYVAKQNEVTIVEQPEPLQLGSQNSTTSSDFLFEVSTVVAVVGDESVIKKINTEIESYINNEKELFARALDQAGLTPAERQESFLLIDAAEYEATDSSLTIEYLVTQFFAGDSGPSQRVETLLIEY